MKIYKSKGRAREYSPLALNYFRGCDHNCAYCYVPRMMLRFNKNYKHYEVSCDNNFLMLKQSAKKLQGCNKQILLSFTSDPYCNYETTETAQVLEILNYYKHKVAILTKNPEKAFKDIEIIKKFGERIKIGSTLTFDNNKDSTEWERYAALPESRINGLKQFAKEGINTWASFEPVIMPSQSLNMLKKVAKFINHVKIGKLNNWKYMEQHIDWHGFLYEAIRICRENNLPFYVKKDLAIHKKDIYLHKNEIKQDYLNL